MAENQELPAYVLQAINNARNGKFARYPYLAHNGCAAICGITIQTDADNTAAAVVLTELDENRGPSITNAIEVLADLTFHEHLHPLGIERSNVWLIEHYGPMSYRSGQVKVSFALVTFDSFNADGKPLQPTWHHLHL